VQGLRGQRIAGAAAFVSMADEGGGARIAGAAAFVSMAGKRARARIAGMVASRSVAQCITALFTKCITARSI
jgi:hypothetical protein